MGQQEGRAGQAVHRQAGRSFPERQKLFFVPSIMAISAAASVTWTLCQSFLQPPHPSVQQGEVLAPAHFVSTCGVMLGPGRESLMETKGNFRSIQVPEAWGALVRSKEWEPL